MIYYDIMMMYDSILFYLFGGCYLFPISCWRQNRDRTAVCQLWRADLKELKEGTLIFLFDEKKAWLLVFSQIFSEYLCKPF